MCAVMTASSPAAGILAGARTYVEKGEQMRATAAFSKAAKLDTTEDPAIPIELCMALINACIQFVELMEP